jgi:hypothetical protein
MPCVRNPRDEVKKRFVDGLAQLVPLLEEHKFQRMARKFGRGSGGPFAEATFGREDRSITLWLRDQSLSVIYRCGDAEADHLTHMRELAGIGGPNEFPTSRATDRRAVRRALREHAGRLGRTPRRVRRRVLVDGNQRRRSHGAEVAWGRPPTVRWDVPGTG